MPTFELRHPNGEEAGSFACSAPNWNPGDVFMKRPGDSWRIVSIEAGETETVWTVERAEVPL